MRFELASTVHEPALRQMIREEAMPGWVRLRYGREPDFFQGLGVEGPFAQAFVALDEAGRVAGMGTRAVKPAWIDGRADVIGYLGGLRLRPGARGGLALAGGFRFVRELHGDGRCRFHLTSILEDNLRALDVLTGARAGLPHYLPAGRFCCHAASPASLARLPGARTGLVLRTGDEVGLPRLLDFLSREGARRQCFPILKAEDFTGGYLRGLVPADFMLACSPDDEILGCAALWDQTAFKQLHVEGYAWHLRLAMPLLRPLARLTRGFDLPRPGGELRLLNLAFLCVRDDDPAVLTALFRAAGADPRSRGAHGLVFGFHEQDPLRPRNLPGFGYTSRAFLVCWDPDMDDARRLLASPRPLHLELACM